MQLRRLYQLHDKVPLILITVNMNMSDAIIASSICITRNPNLNKHQKCLSDLLLADKWSAV